LNRASRFCRSDKFIFLDNDINPIPGVDIFAGCSAMLEASDLVELSKEAVGEGPIAAMMKHEFLVNLWGTRIFVDGTGRNPLMNGAAFAVRKSLFRQLGGFAPVINEDIDFAARAFLENARFGIDPALRVQNDVPSSPADWLSQRKRWAISFGLWNATYARKLREKAPETARFRASATTIFYLPFLTATAAFTSIIIGLSERRESQFGLFTASSVAAFLIVGLHCAKEAKYFGQEFSWISYVFFSLVYCPIWAISSVLGIAVVALKGVPEMDWEYGRYTDTGKGHQRS
jgi:cellulose synthase/poly-beta-1,6-N-acetylglucosamine synthase-like glycosyltransferase